MDTFDPARVNLVFAGNLLTGFMPGTFIQVAREEDTWTPMVGADGRVARARNRNQMARITVTLMMTSPSNDVLSALHNLDQATGSATGACSLTDSLGRTSLSGDEAFLLRPADVEYSNEIVARTWTIMVPKLEGVVGGSL